MEMIATSLTVNDFNAARHAYVIPDWQRGEVWDTWRKQALIDSLLRGIKLPKLYFAKVGKGKHYEVVDGQQRISTIRDFLDGKFSLSALTMQIFNLQSGRFGDLPARLAKKIMAFVLEVDEISEAERGEKTEYFQRLQQGMPLAAREKLNAVPSGIADYARNLTEHPFFQQRVDFKDTRSAYFDVTSKAVAIAIDGLTTSMRFKNMLALFERQSGFSPASRIARNLDATLDFLERAFPEKNEALRDRSFVQSVLTLASQLVAGGQSDGQEAAFGKFVTEFHNERARYGKLLTDNADQDFVRFNSILTGKTLENAKIRHEILVRKMGVAQPALVTLLAPYSGTDYWVVNDPVVHNDTFPPPSPLVMVAKSETLDEIYARREQLVIPGWQRGQVWNNSRRQMLIDSILEGWKLPNFISIKMAIKTRLWMDSKDCLRFLHL